MTILVVEFLIAEALLINTEDVNEKEENNVYNLFYIAYYNYMRCSEYK